MSARIHLSVPRGHRVPRRVVEKAVQATLEAEGATEGEISVVFLRDERMRALNLHWLEHDRTTDVLSFALHDSGTPPFGDVYVGIEQAERQAAEHGVPRDEELVRLVVHGVLHLMGYDHPTGSGPGSCGVMYRKQEALVRSILKDEQAAPASRRKAAPTRARRK